MARSRLASGVPRAYPDHRRRVARSYREAITEIRQRLGLNGSGAVLLREYGLVAVELERLHAEVEALQGKPRRRRELARLARRRVILRSQLVALERRLEEIAGSNGHGDRVPTPEELLQGLHAQQERSP